MPDDKELARKLDDAADEARKPDATQTADELEETIDDAADEAESKPSDDRS